MAAAYMVAAFERGRLVCEVGGDGRGLTPDQATYFVHDLRDEFPDAIVAILPAKPCWKGDWPWNTEGRR